MFKSTSVLKVVNDELKNGKNFVVPKRVNITVSAILDIMAGVFVILKNNGV